MNKHSIKLIFLVLLIILTGATGLWLFIQTNSRASYRFDSDRAYQDVLYQVSLGPRTMGSEAHIQTREWIIAELTASGWETEIQSCMDCAPLPLFNLVAWREAEDANDPWIILGAHYDSRFFADQDPEPANHALPVPGANDGASGAALLLELARSLPEQTDKRIWLVFFDAEDNGNIAGYQWIMGSQAFVGSLQSNSSKMPDAAIIVDMIGDSQLEIYREKNSDTALTTSIWQHAAKLGFEQQFINTPRHRILDDHIPFLEAGIPAVDIIDFDYAYWHTTGDTSDKVSTESLFVVGQTLLDWLVKADLPGK